MKSIFGAKQASAQIDVKLDGVSHTTSMALDSFEIEAIFEDAPNGSRFNIAPAIDRYRIVLTGKLTTA
jgi:hypothetical protein